MSVAKSYKKSGVGCSQSVARGVRTGEEPALTPFFATYFAGIKVKSLLPRLLYYKAVF